MKTVSPVDLRFAFRNAFTVVLIATAGIAAGCSHGLPSRPATPEEIARAAATEHIDAGDPNAVLAVDDSVPNKHHLGILMLHGADAATWFDVPSHDDDGTWFGPVVPHVEDKKLVAVAQERSSPDTPSMLAFFLVRSSDGGNTWTRGGLVSPPMLSRFTAASRTGDHIELTFDLEKDLPIVGPKPVGSKLKPIDRLHFLKAGLYSFTSNDFGTTWETGVYRPRS